MFEQVVAVSVLVLESKTTKLDVQSRYNARELLFDIPLAGLVLGRLFVLELYPVKDLWKRSQPGTISFLPMSNIYIDSWLNVASLLTLSGLS